MTTLRPSLRVLSLLSIVSFLTLAPAASAAPLDQFEVTVNPSPATGQYDFDLPDPGVIVAQASTFITVLALQADSAVPVVGATYTLRHLGLGLEAVVPAMGSAAIGAVADVQFHAPTVNGLATIRIDHTPALDPEDEESWRIRIEHNGAAPTIFFGAIDHVQTETQVPRMCLVIGPDLDPVPLEIDFGRATLNAQKIRSAEVLGCGTGDFDLGTTTLSNNPTGFYSLVSAPANGTTVSPNGRETVEVGYQPAAPAPAPPHGGAVTISSTTTGVASQVVDLTGDAVFREIVLTIDASNSMNRANDGTGLADCPVASTRAANFDPDSRIRQVRAALEIFRTKLIEYGDERSFLGVVRFPGGDLACGSGYNDSLSSPQSTWSTVDLGLTLFDDTNPTFTSKINDATDDGFYHGTPMKQGLQTAISQFSGATNDRYRAIILLSDGAFNVPNESQASFLNGVMPTLTNQKIRVFAVAFGETTSVDPDTLTKLASQSTPSEDLGLGLSGFQHYDPEAPGNDDAIEQFFTQLLTDLMELEIETDPPATILQGQTRTHTARVTEHDQRVTFSIAWRRPVRGQLGFELIAPNGTRITPNSSQARFYSGPKHKMYAVDVPELDASFVGQWTLEVTYPLRPGLSAPPDQTAAERYVWDVITRSHLELDVEFDRQRYYAGDTVTVEAQLLERGRAVTGQTVTLQVTRPDQGIGNWHAANSYPVAVIEDGAASGGLVGGTEPLPLALQKHFFLTQVQGVALPAYVAAVPGGVPLRDDGKDGDRRAGDGIYSAVLAGITGSPGTYEFDVVAEGATSAGTAFRRQQIVQHYVSIRPDVTFAFTDASFVQLARIPPGFEVSPGVSFYQAYIRPEDHLGNLLGPGYANDVVIESSIGTPVTPVTDDLEGGYTRLFTVADGAGTPVAEFELGDLTFPPVAAGPVLGDARGELTYFLAGTGFDDDLAVDDSVTFGVELGFRLTDRVLLGGEFSATHTDDFAGDGGAVFQLLASLEWELPNLIPAIRPYLDLGAGTVSFEDFTLEDNAGVYALGLGLKIRLTPRARGKLELRYLQIGSNDLGPSSDNLQLLWGVSHGF